VQALRFDQAELQAGDVLLSLGNSDLSRGIAALDGGSYAHAALWTGASVIESTLPIVREASLATCAASARYIDVFRPRESRSNLDAVLASSRQLLGRPYGALDLTLTAAAVTVSAWMPSDWAQMVTLFGAGNLGRLLRLLRQLEATGDQLVTCVGLVVQSYIAGGDPLTVTLQSGRRFRADTLLAAVKDLARRKRTRTNDGGRGRVGLFEPSVVPARAIDPELDWLERFELPAQETARVYAARSADELLSEARALEREWQTGMGAAGQIEGERIAGLEADVLRVKRLHAGRDLPPNLVTPRQLENSPDLDLVGRVHAASD